MQPHQSLEQHSLTRTTTADDKVGLARLKGYTYVVEHRTAIKSLEYILTLNHRIIWVRIRLKIIIIIELITTAVVEALPTSRELPLA